MTRKYVSHLKQSMATSPNTIFGPVEHALSRRDLDHAILPTKVPSPGRRQLRWSDIAEQEGRIALLG